MGTKDARIPEGGAIRDEDAMSAEEYGRLMISRLEGEYRRFAKEALAYGKPPRGGLVLEIGPGPGWAGIMLLKERPDLRLIGIDASEDMLRAASANAKAWGVAGRARYAPGSAEAREGAETGSADLVVSRDSLHHWENPLSAFASIARVLKPDGALYLSDERRNISAAAWAFVAVFGWLSMGRFSRYWRSSIRAGYTAGEARAFAAALVGRERLVEEGFIDLRIMAGPLAPAQDRRGA